MDRLGMKVWIGTLAALWTLGGFAPLPSPAAAEDGATLVAQAKKKKKAKGKKPKDDKKKKPSEVPEFEKKKPDKEAAPEEELSTGPAKIKLPMVEEKKGEKVTLEEQLLDKEIAQLKEIIADPASEGPSKADLLFRLAERYYEKARAIYYTEMQDYDRRVVAWMEAREKNPNAPEPKMDSRKSKVYTEQAMAVYEVILKKYKDYMRRDEVLFTIGYNRYESGNKAEGVKMYWELIKSYPDSRFVPDAYLAMGEHYFNSNDVFNAKKAYEKAASAKDNEKVYTFAVYKLAWCDYNLGEYEKGIEKFKQVVELSIREAQKGVEGDKNKILLQKEALQDMVLAYSQIDALETAEEYYLSQVGKQGALEYMRKLARTYEKQGKAEMTVKSYRRLLDEYPTDPDCPAFHNSIVQAYRKLNDRAKVTREINRLIDQYKPGTTWAEVNKANTMAIKKANSLVEESLRDLVTSYHKEAQETKSWDTYNLTRGIYAKYLETFPESEYAYKLRWYYADILYKMGDFYGAAGQYTKLVDVDPKGDYSQESAYNSVLCWEKCMVMRDTDKADCREWKPKKGGKVGPEESKVIQKQNVRFIVEGKVAKEELERKEIPFFETRFLASADRYAQLAPGHDMYIPIRFKCAFIFYTYRHFDEMAKRFGEIIERYPDNENALKAVRLSLNSLYMKSTLSETEAERNKAWSDVNHWAKTFAANKVLMGSATARKEKFETEIQSLIEESGYNVVLALRQTDALQAASGFDRFVKDYPKSKYAHRALYAAMVIYDEANQLDLAIGAGKKLLKAYPDSDRINPTIGFLAAFHDRVADFSQAAFFNEMYFKKWLEQEGKQDEDEGGKKVKARRKPAAKKPAARGKGKDEDKVEEILIADKEAADALYNAGLLREKTGDFGKAIGNYVRYIKFFPDAKDTHDIYYKVGEIYERQAKIREADRVFEGYPKKYGDRSSPGRNLAVVYKRARFLRELGNAKDADKLLDQIIEAFNKLDEKARDADARMAVAYARFLQVDREFTEYLDLKLVLPASVLKKNLFKKIEIRPKLAKKYEEIVGYADPDWTVAALVRVGELSQNLADSMLEAPVPGGLTPEQADIYVEELQKQALPLEETAILFYRKAVEVSNSKGIYNSWTLTAQDKLRKYETTRFPAPYEAAFVSTEFFYDLGPQLDKVEVPEAPPEPEPAPAPGPAPGGDAAPAGEAPAENSAV